MNSILKVGLWIVGVVAVLALVAIAAFALLFDPNALRDDITRLVAEKTGRELVIDGELSLSFYPWLGFAAGETSLSNAEGFNEPLMLRFDSASASVKLLPLLSRRVELSQVTLDGVELNLRRNASGQTNWDDLLELSADDTADDADKGDAAFATQSIGGVTLRDAVINFVDEPDDASYNLTAVDLEVGGIEPGEPFDFSAEGEALLSSPAMAGPFTASGTGLLGDDDSLTIGKPRFSITATGESIPGETLKLQLEANSIDVGEPDIVLDLPVLYLNGEAGGDPWNTLDATIRAPAVSLSDYDRFVVTTPTMIATVRSPTFTDSVEVELKGRTLKGAIESQAAVLDGAVIETMGMNIEAAKIDVTQFIDAPTLRGQIEIDQFKPRPVLAHFGAADIITADPAAMSAAIVSAEAFYTPDAMGLRNMTAKLDQSNIGGSVSYTTTEQVRFDLTVDSVDIDRYRSPSESTDGAAAGVEEVDIPVDVLRELNLDGTLKVGEMQLVGLQSTDVTVGIKAAGGKLRVNPSRASLYGGTYQGDISLDVTGAQPVLKLNERLQNVQFGPFSRDLLDASRLSGTLSGRITTTGSGATADAITASTSGNAEFAFKDGAYEGVDIWHRVRRARAVIKGGEAPAAPAEKRTRFADLTGTANIADGVLYTDDLSMVLPFMKVRGSGNLKLLSQELDFKFRGDIVDRPELTADVNDLVGVTIPLKVTGAVSQPDVNIDMGAVLAEVAKRKLGDKLGLGDGEPGQDAEDAIDQKKEELKDEIEDKLKDKLKDLFGGGG